MPPAAPPSHLEAVEAPFRTPLRQSREDGRTNTTADQGLWVCGLAVAVALVVGAFLPLDKVRNVWDMYLVLGVSVPAAAFALGRLQRLSRLAGPTNRVQRALVLVVGTAVLARMVLHFDPLALVAASLQVFLVSWRRGRARQAPPLQVWVVSLGAWSVADSLVWWQPAGLWLVGDHYTGVLSRHAAIWSRALDGFAWVRLVRWLASGFYSTLAFLLAFGLVVAALWPRSSDAAPSPTRRRVEVGASLALLALASFRDGILFENISLIHWSYYVGPAELVRQGGILLWDVPSQYGFLSTLALATLPTPTPWESLFLLSGLLNLVSSAVVFLILRSLLRGSMGLVLSLALALATVFLRNNVGPGLVGPDMYPSTGGFRFGWCLLLMVLPLLALKGDPRRQRLVLLAGSLIWVVGMLWSAESAIYCSATWLPAHALLAAGLQPRPTNWLRWIGWWALPFATLGVTLLLVMAGYQADLGRMPDPLAFVDYGLIYQGGFGAWPLDPLGPGWVLLMAFSMGVQAIVTLAGRPRRRPRLALALAATGALGSTASYFVGRSHPNNVWNLLPVVVVAIGLMLRLLPGPSRQSMPALARLAVAPLFVIVLAATYGDLVALARYLLLPPRNPARVEAGLPRADPSLVALTAAAGLGPSDPVIYIGRSPTLPPEALGMEHHPAWLPMAPAEETGLLAAGRRRAYIDRFRDRCGSGGWLVEPVPTAPSAAWFRKDLDRDFQVTTAAANRSWRLTRYEPRHPSPRRLACTRS